ncbi:MAG: xanthine dehydrogenase family protein molybdopterin-binding subunit [Deltaproteobacteria bacterium]|nr:xanthine dehydrogenase family protein molybdopterin-binding subunit [Deltaproteobacteria bacterium]MBW2016617.1 xanthine dehydrogenase family protein molybdopterin-binding subunit [Deltaproteobacteria bacterium]MBW2129519.1 xanthine dehydrogenase family protein molybdopterin-binding subunit [Deltaproteobacteria bacterium]MBW2305190.1 xanthine dehydrogenase family protein molybdopterin-binding subunit [Deltaproteobacteria bacterium]
MKTAMTRREFMKDSLAAAGLTIIASVTPFGYRLVNASEMKKDEIAAFNPTAWIRITPDDIVTLTMGPTEMGQGTHTSLAMVIADELEADWKKVRIRMGEARPEFINPILHVQLTVASASIRAFYMPLRTMGAACQAMLLEAAARQWKVPKKECRAIGGKVFHKKSNRSLTYGQLCLEAAKLKVPENPPLKKEKEFKFIGKKIPRMDIPDKVSGKAVYGLDFSLPGLHYAVIARPPAYGAKPVSFDRKAAEAVKGVKKVLEIPQGVAVCAESLDAAWAGRDALKVKWGPGTIPLMDNEYIERSLMEDLDKPGSKAVSTGDVEAALKGAKSKVKAIYFVPFVAHATMEPMNCTVHVRSDGCDIWAPTQGQTVPQAIASKITGLPKDKVNVHTTFLGCGLGRRGRPDFIVEALIIGKALGKPVKVVWTREEDIKYDAFRAAMSHRIEAGLDDKGQVIAWSHKTVSPSILKDINPKGIQNGVDFMSLWGLADFPKSPHNNRIMYEIPNLYIEFLISKLPIPVAPWRSVQNGPNAFVIESFIDELAHAVGKDPLEFRLAHLKNNKRPRRVLETVAEKAGWGRPLPEGMGRGIAQHSCFGTYVAQVAEVSVNKREGTFKVHRLVIAVDCGPAVHPFNIKTQIEGAATIALSTVLREEVKFSKGGVESANFDDYSPIRITEVPDIEVHIIKSNDKIGGIGEPGVPPTAPAVANAIFNATGARVRRIPITPERLLEAMKKA